MARHAGACWQRALSDCRYGRRVSGQRARSAVPAAQRSALPQIPGIPWWGAVVLAITLTAIGFAYDAGSGTKSLSAAFAVCYVTGCVLAVLAVQQSGLFSAVIQPPLILFVAVPSAYFAFHSSEIAGIKDILINCGYPLIERFPLMFLTAASVLLIGMARWYLGMTAHRGEPADDAAAEEPAEGTSAAAAAIAKLVARFSSKPATEAEPSRRSRRHTIERPTRSALDDVAPRPARRSRPSESPRSRHARPPETETFEPMPSRPRRPRPGGPPVDPAADPRRRRPQGDEVRDRRNAPPVGRRGAPERGERPVRRERADRYERPERYDRPERQERRHRMPDYPAYEPHEPAQTNGAGPSTHHPVSRVRYRGSDDEEPRVEHRTRPRSRNATPDAWEYDS